MEKLTLKDMENVQAGKMACWAALALYGAAFVGFAAATGGIAIVAGAITFGGSIYEAIDSCR